ncbi:thioredoxin 1 [Desulfosalsimonas propionicica]|uniref:Thioredoxin 1 n=1 Tax=Desulfosalsimonas propionicica TaxID=332175 RepID=A0A7W0HK75_9BACT|nr:thioredoxin family protein [Desulfosalsimonas propionicica]MBA2880922.1 thioredoxin 1 [Desulfosalsimonas propionicica]
MRSKTKMTIIAAVVLLAAASVWGVLQTGNETQSSSGPASQQAAAASPAPGEVTLLDLGADQCRPCKMMAPILEELKQAYEGRAKIIFIDVWKNREQAEKYGIRAIPTQIFFNEKGEEVRRHTGFMDKKTIIRNLSDMGVKPPEQYRGL